ncbi:hypothetical protein C0Q70_13773 [Pomacea canaliculata]|uniref:Uncharacterized protein n=1 Tax=Pomacea canaliculata TaxID=400727 RepID=A0A2T7NY54_POMCA|nr:hypothetical protein C0Q70_13773 [Pomacea canaliculata]
MQFVHAYNRSYHRSIKRAPVEVDADNQEDVWQTLYGEQQQQELVTNTMTPGDRVRISKASRIYDSEPTTYVLKGDHGDELRGTFYSQELQKVGAKDMYRIEEILKQRVGAGGRKGSIKSNGTVTMLHLILGFRSHRSPGTDGRHTTTTTTTTTTTSSSSSSQDMQHEQDDPGQQLARQHPGVCSTCVHERCQPQVLLQASGHLPKQQARDPEVLGHSQDVSAEEHEQRGQGQGTASRRRVQGRETVHVLRVDVGAVAQQQLGGVQVVGQDGVVQRCQTHVVRLPHVHAHAGGLNHTRRTTTR